MRRNPNIEREKKTETGGVDISSEERTIAIPLNRGNLQMVAALTGIDPVKLARAMVEEKIRNAKEGKIEAACEFFGKDRAWYDKTMEKVWQIEKELPKELDNKERIVRMYGWIAESFPDKNFNLPFYFDETREFMKANAVKLILNDYDLYLKIINWD